jgi:hypothetical protein
MSIQKKSLISALKTTKKANVASTELVKGENRTSMKAPGGHAVMNAKKVFQPKQFLSGKKAIEPKRFTNMKKTMVE